MYAPFASSLTVRCGQVVDNFLASGGYLQNESRTIISKVMIKNAKWCIYRRVYGIFTQEKARFPNVNKSFSG